MSEHESDCDKAVFVKAAQDAFVNMFWLACGKRALRDLDASTAFTWQVHQVASSLFDQLSGIDERRWHKLCHGGLPFIVVDGENVLNATNKAGTPFWRTVNRRDGVVNRRATMSDMLQKMKPFAKSDSALVIVDKRWPDFEYGFEYDARVTSKSIPCICPFSRNQIDDALVFSIVHALKKVCPRNEHVYVASHDYFSWTAPLAKHWYPHAFLYPVQNVKEGFVISKESMEHAYRRGGAHRRADV